MQWVEWARNTPGVSTAYWAAYRLPFRLRYLRRRLADGGRAPAVAFAPERPHPLSVAAKVCSLAGARVVGPDQPHDLAVHFSLATHRPLPAELAADPGRVLNAGCTDISKTAVEAAHREAFGYGLAVDPTASAGVCVEKSDANAEHDGRELRTPVPPDRVRPGRVYQRVVDNVTADGTEVEDLRVVVVGTRVPLVYRKHRPVSDRFSNDNSRAEVVPAGSVLSDDETARLLHLCRLLGADTAELDVLRDRGDGRAYVVDLNPTPNGPPNHLPPADARRALDVVTRAFTEEFLAPAHSFG
ncbi:hypothetical protein JOD57_000959 [Geodermatophilus bullaregiensis]|uniref:hypothetical protein n=1 Tax=Geodermatophilus bullaregiensis TaxID=1564160 RepID=UPI0019570A06|nr:hypothetical protein [Geodermatophilus bullaregiensis]MBM7805122.1 hypothetical protein [Geodermatophilus bullaregiensis]